jgi:glycosyltransferase involved in cell wall biosynthesis
VKIALVSDWYRPRVGGIEFQIESLAARLVAAGHAVTVITPTPGGDADGAAGISLNSAVETEATRSRSQLRGVEATRSRSQLREAEASTAESGVRVHRLPAVLCPGCGLMWTPRAFRELRVQLSAGDFDVVHAHSSIISPAAYGALAIAVRQGLPAVVTVHSIWGHYRHLLTAIDRAVRWSRWPVVFSAVSECAARDLRLRLGATPVAILPNAVDPAEWNVVPAPPADTISIACVMRMARRKRGRALVALMPRVLAALPARASRLRLRIAGDGPERPEMERLADRLRVAGSIDFLGQLDHAGVRQLFAGCSGFVLPTRLEAFGIAALEARAAGLPVVAMRAGGVAEFVRHEQEGLLADDDDDLAAQLVRLVTEPGLRERIAVHNRATPVEFTWDRTLAAHLAAYERASRLVGRFLPPPVFP